MKCHIISIGDELLRGDTLNTNAAWLGDFFSNRGVKVTEVDTIADEEQAIQQRVQSALQKAQLVITTGGLGPTHDDITKQAMARLFDAPMVRHQPTLTFIKKRFKKRNIPFSDSNYAQAEVPENCEVLLNTQGTAPGLWFTPQKNRALAVLPGIPREMKALVKQEIWPRIQEKVPIENRVFTHFIKVAGIGESTLSDDVIGSLDKYLTDDISVAYLPSPMENTIRINTRASSAKEADAIQHDLLDYIQRRAKKYIIGEGKDAGLSASLGKVLRKHGLTLSVAESCTGGMLGDTLTDVPGSSDYFIGGVMAYANKVKINQLQVSEAAIERNGAVSQPVALQMAKGVANLMDTDIGISTTGIAGPGGGTEAKPVGTVWIGFWSKNSHFAIQTTFGQHRKLNKTRSVAVALETARRTILQINPMPYGLQPHFA